MNLLTLLSHLLKSGEVNLSTGNEKFLQLIVKTQQMSFNIIDNKFLKGVLKDNLNIKFFRELFKLLRKVAEELKSEGVTVTISYKGVRVLTLGSDTKPNFSQLITGTTEIEINNLRKLIQLGLL